MVAVEDGVVTYAGNDLPGYGNMLLVRHADGYTASTRTTSCSSLQRAWKSGAASRSRRWATPALSGTRASISSSAPVSVRSTPSRSWSRCRRWSPASPRTSPPVRRAVTAMRAESLVAPPDRRWRLHPCPRGRLSRRHRPGMAGGTERWRPRARDRPACSDGLRTAWRPPSTVRGQPTSVPDAFDPRRQRSTPTHMRPSLRRGGCGGGTTGPASAATARAARARTRTRSCRHAGRRSQRSRPRSCSR